MRSTICALLITLAAAVLITAAIHHGQNQADLRDQITTLERRIAHQQTMLDDAHAYYPILERRVVKVTTDLTPREVLWTMAEQLREAGVEVKLH